jgi:ERCC4-type nuclease
MDPRLRKLQVLGIPEAENLIDAGLDSPRKIRAASDEMLEKVRGVGPSTRADIRKRFERG